jgi:hypothetical protein
MSALDDLIEESGNFDREMASLASLAAIELAKLRLNASGRYIKGGEGSHWEGCEETHFDCKIAKLEKENEQLRAELKNARELVNYNLEPTPPEQPDQDVVIKCPKDCWCWSAEQSIMEIEGARDTINHGKEYPIFIMSIGNHRCELTPCCRQEYSNCYFEAGLINGHPIETVYFRLQRNGEEPTTICLRTDELHAIVWVINGALWSKSMEEK